MNLKIKIELLFKKGDKVVSVRRCGSGDRVDIGTMGVVASDCGQDDAKVSVEFNGKSYESVDPYQIRKYSVER